MKKRPYISIAELAKLLGVSRIAVYKKVKKGEIKAVKIGRGYAISVDVLKSDLTNKDKDKIMAAVKKTVREYGEVLKLLGRE